MSNALYCFYMSSVLLSLMVFMTNAENRVVILFMPNCIPPRKAETREKKPVIQTHINIQLQITS